ncbi:MAG: hypothetical protein LUD72_02745, partial [Bacteroidales bacterium]|nr:hypothetical protein [Bacteroidales bacterium]
MEQNSTVRIRTAVDATKDAYYLPLPLEQTYDTIEILSLKLDQKNDYKYYQSPTGVIVGRVYANGGFGVQNAAVSVFVAVGNDDTTRQRLLYNYTAINDVDNNNVRYNILESEVDDACHQDVGTFPSKRRVLDNGDVIEMFDKYYSITTRTNASGDYMLTGIPSNSTVTLHMDCDLSDIGLMSQRPRDLVYKGYDINLFDNPNKFKKDENLNSLTQIITQNKSVYVYPYFAESTSNEDGSNVGITRVDFDLNYKIESTCVFMGSVVTDKGNNAINEKCRAGSACGKNDSLIASEGTIEMIRKRPDGKVEEFQIKGNQLIDGDGVWCYQIPMNLDYVTTDEYGNLVPTEDPDKGIPTRTRVRFRIGVSETPEDGTARKRCKYLVPNNPRLDSERYPVFSSTLEPDYEFGSNTSDENFRDLFWNNVYTVKNYIPQLQTEDSYDTRKNTGIKWINHYGDNNPFPFNALTVKLSFTYRIMCIVVKVIIQLIEFLNEIMGMISGVFCLLYNIFKGFKEIPLIGKVIYVILYPVIYILGLIANAFVCVGLSSDFCDDEVNRYTYYPGCGKWPFMTADLPKNMRCIQQTTAKKHNENERSQYDSEEEYLESATVACFETATLYTCVENQLAQDNDATSFSFSNDWVNGVLYLPLWYRKIKAKKSFLFGLIHRKAKDQWCSGNKTFNSLRLYKGCELKRSEDRSNQYNNFEGKAVNPRTTVASNACKKKNCKKQKSQVQKMKGVIVTRETMMGQTIYYYKAVQYSSSLSKNSYDDRSKKGEVELLFATDIVLLGSLNECDLHGIPQFFKWLEPTTYNLPNDILDSDQDISYVIDSSGNATEDLALTIHTTETGCDWGNTNSDQCGSPDGGLFYGIGCTNIEMYPKTCFNLSRICEFGVSKDVVKKVENLAELQGSDTVADDDKWLLIPDGYVSYDE